MFIDTFCGLWEGRHWKPNGCRYRHITSEEARKCVGNRSLSFIGDSQIRDMGIGVALFLSGMTIAEGGEHKFDKRSHIFDEYNHKCFGCSRYILPKRSDVLLHKWNWQVQLYEFYSHEHLEEVNDGVTNAIAVMRNNISCGYNKTRVDVKPSSVVFWNHGMHDTGWYIRPPHGEQYYEQIVGRWMRARSKATVPNVFVSANNQCLDMLNAIGVGYKFMELSLSLQVHMIEEAIYYSHKMLRKEHLPYWDASEVLRSPSRCHVTGDGLHVKMYVDLVRANMLFNKLCDENNNWRENIEDQFMF